MDAPSMPKSSEFWIILASILASLFGGGALGTLFTLWMNRKKPEAEIHETRSKSVLNLATAQKIDVEASVNASEAVLSMLQQLTFAELQNASLREDLEKVTADYETMKAENRTYELQLRRAKATLKLNGIIFDGKD